MNIIWPILGLVHVAGVLLYVHLRAPVKEEMRYATSVEAKREEMKRLARKFRRE